LGIGARCAEIRHLYEGVEGGMRAYPSYAVVPAFPAVVEMLERAQAPRRDILHNAARIVIHRPIPPEATVHTVATLRAAYDLKRFAELTIDTETSCDGSPLFDTEWTILVRGAGGFGGSRPSQQARAPRLGRDSTPDWSFVQATSPEQALLYRLSGDINPLHADARVAAEVGFSAGPILHGLCTFGFLARAVILTAASGDATRLRSLSAQFRKPVWPGDTLVIEGHAPARAADSAASTGPGRVTVGLVVKVQGKPDPVVTNAWAEIAPASETLA